MLLINPLIYFTYWKYNKLVQKPGNCHNDKPDNNLQKMQKQKLQNNIHSRPQKSPLKQSPISYRNTVSPHQNYSPNNYNPIPQRRSTHRPIGYQQQFGKQEEQLQQYCQKGKIKGNRSYGPRQAQEFGVLQDRSHRKCQKYVHAGISGNQHLYPDNRRKTQEVKIDRQFLTMGPTPRLTVKESHQNQSQQSRFSGIRHKKTQRPTEREYQYQQSQQQEAYRQQHQNLKVKRLDKIDPAYSSYPKQQIRNIYSQNSYQNTANPNINYVQSQRHSHKRSQLGPIPNNYAMFGHRRLATTVQMYEDQSSKAQTQEEDAANHGGYDEDYDGDDYGDDGQELYNDDAQYGYYQQGNSHAGCYQSANNQMRSPFMKSKPGSPVMFIELQQKYKDIENTLNLENENLKEHNQYLLAVIKKLQIKQRKNKENLNQQNILIEKLSEERNAYMERCIYLQEKVNQLEKQVEENNRGIVKHCSVLNLNQGQHSRGTSDYNSEHIKNMNQMDRLQKINELKHHLQNTLQSSKSKSVYSHQRNSTSSHKHSQPNQNSFPNLAPSSSPHLPPQLSPQLSPYIQSRPHCPSPLQISPNSNQKYSQKQTPQFSPEKQSPVRRPRLTAKISYSSNGSQINNNSILQQNQNIDFINNSHSFGNGFNKNNDSGYEVVNGLRNQIGRCETIENVSDIEENTEEMDRNQTHPNKDNKKTAKNSHNNTKNLDLDICKKIEELNKKFEELMKIYRVSHDIKLRKECVEIAKKIKELKNDAEKNKEIQEQKKWRIQMGNQEEGEEEEGEDEEGRDRNGKRRKL